MGYEKFMMDVDQAGMMHTLLAGVDLSENGQAMDAIREVGPGNHFLGCAHTQANFENAFYRSPLADNNSFEQWQAEGSLDIAQRANASWKKQLASMSSRRSIRRSMKRCWTTCSAARPKHRTRTSESIQARRRLGSYFARACSPNLPAQQLEQLLRVDRLDQVVMKPGRGGAVTVLLLTPAGHGDQ